MRAPQQLIIEDLIQDRPRVRLRQVIFWLHLLAGVVAGLIIGLMSITGVLLAFERQVVAFAERERRTVQPPASHAPRLSLDTLMTQARDAVPEGTPSSVTLKADPAAAVTINFGREQAIFVNPYTGEVLGEGATALREIFHVITDWHRWLGTEGDSRDLGRAITGACNAAFVVMVITGLYLWWPRRWSRRALQAILVPRVALRGKPRDWNWHNTAGFWSAAILFCMALTGLIMSYQWANDLLYTLTGNTPPPPRPQQASASRPVVSRTTGRAADGSAGSQARTAEKAVGERRQRPDEAKHTDSAAPRASLETLLTVTTQQAPHWRSIVLRLPPRDASRISITLEEAASWHPYPRSLLTLDATTAAVVQWEPYASYNLGRMLRAWVRPVHTGEAGGLLGQSVAALASAAGVVLVWTGLALAWRRFRGRKARTRQRESDVMPL